jgi:rhomboid protease GluP
MILSGVSPTHPTIDNLLHWGANCGPYVLLGHQWWRLITAAFVHEGPLHIATNMWCLWNLGLLGEPLLGAFGMFAVYLLTGVSGNLLSIALHPGVPNGPQGIVSVGASGAVFGLAGVLIMLLKSPLLPLPPGELRQLRRSVINFAILNFVLGGGANIFFGSYVQIDNMAHLGGFLCGLALGVPLVPRIGASKIQFVLRQRVAYGGMLLLTLVLAFGIVSFWR